MRGEFKAGGSSASAYAKRNFLCTFLARQLAAKVGRAALRSNHPRPVLPRRIVADMLGVAALEVGDPIAVLVLMKGNNSALRKLAHRNSLRLRR